MFLTVRTKKYRENILIDAMGIEVKFVCQNLFNVVEKILLAENTTDFLLAQYINSQWCRGVNGSVCRSGW